MRSGGLCKGSYKLLINSINMVENECNNLTNGAKYRIVYLVEHTSHARGRPQMGLEGG